MRTRARTAYGLLSDVARVTLAEPLRYDQTVALIRKDDQSFIYDEWPSCGTIGCRAGWVCVLTGIAMNPMHQARGVVTEAKDILGLDGEQAGELFDEHAVRGVPQTKAHARAGARGIAAFQKRYKSQLLATKLKDTVQIVRSRRREWRRSGGDIIE